MSNETLHSFTRRLDAADRAIMREVGHLPDNPVSPVRRTDESEFSLAAMISLRDETSRRISAGDWATDRGRSDRWLAPRLHFALRVPRSVASDRSMWEWLATSFWTPYVDWRWSGEKGVTDDRWYGAVNKQSLARLWWGGELFRDGQDYEPVTRAFLMQDLPNSFLHRPLVRCRSFALGIVDGLFADETTDRKAREINDLARVLNLCTSGTPPEATVGFQVDDVNGFDEWASTDVIPPDDWDSIEGPPLSDTTSESRQRGRALATHGMAIASSRRGD